MPRAKRLDLSFPTIPIGRNQTPWSLEPLLYQGGASTMRRDVRRAIKDGLLGDVLGERVELVRLCHESISSKLVSGGSIHTATSEIQSLEKFFLFSENREGGRLSITDVEDEFLEWTEHLLHRHQVVGDLGPSTIYSESRRVASTLDYALGRVTPLIELTRIREPRPQRGRRLEAQDLEATFAFGHLLQDICDGLSLDAIWGPRPIRISLRRGGEYILWAGLLNQDPEARAKWSKEHTRRGDEQEARYQADRSIDGRAVAINARIEAELLMFIGQTGMNLAQANKLKTRHFSYSSDIDGYQIRDYKHRRGGEVLFEIFREYRAHFERYLAWRRALFPDSHRLFPFIRRGRQEDAAPHFWNLQKACKNTGVAWTPAAQLRRTRVNWLLRRSGDPGLTAEMSQHHTQTLLAHYALPSQQRAISEITRFWLKSDPVLRDQAQTPSIAPGACDGVPSSTSDRPAMASEPDCVRPSGCLWCEHHRDIDSLNHVWALASFRHLKILETGKHCPSFNERTTSHPADHAIARISAKLAWFRDSNARRRSWVQEALARIEEERYHPDWERLIHAVEGAAA